MKITKREALFFVEINLIHHQITHNIRDVILDTGAAHTIINMNATELAAEPTTDDFVFMSGIRGHEAALRKTIDEIHFDTFHVTQCPVDLGFFDEHPDLNGLFGVDILIQGHFVIDLNDMVIYQKKLSE